MRWRVERLKEKLGLAGAWGDAGDPGWGGGRGDDEVG